MDTSVTSHVRKGLLIASALVLIDLIGQLSKLYLTSWYSAIGVVLFVMATAWSVFFYGKQAEHAVRFSDLFAHGFKVAAVVTCIVFIYKMLSVYVLFPESIQEMLDAGLEEARKKTTISPEQLQQGMEMGRKVLKISILAGGLLVNLLIGVVGGVVGAVIAQKNLNSRS